MSSSALSVFQSGNLAVNGRRDLFVLTSVSSSNGYTMMLVLTRRHDFKKNGRGPVKIFRLASLAELSSFLPDQ